MSLIYNATFDSQTRVLSLLDKAGNVISSCEVPSNEKYLTLTATEDNSSVTLEKVGGSVYAEYEYRKNGGAWTSDNGRRITLNASDRVEWRCTGGLANISTEKYVQFVMTGKIAASNPVTSMIGVVSDHTRLYGRAPHLFKDCTSLVQAPELPATALTPNCYYNMFYGCTSLVQAPELPATALNDSCYSGMFYGCTGLTQAPKLPATTLSEYCYSRMFKNCTSLVQAPELPATALYDSCYSSMFYGCTGLTQAPKLPATALYDSCYSSMFYGCTGLTQAPKLPATALYDRCYSSMFKGCTGLTQAPALPATRLMNSTGYANYCYQSMFEGCTSLVQAPELPAKTITSRCYLRMFYGCTGLTQAPALPATRLSYYCYTSMFEGCTSLVQAPELPATTLDNYCYQSMFGGCTSLVQAPELPATALKDYCYQSMFKNCTSLVQAPALPAATLATNCYYQMFNGCSNLKEVRIAATKTATYALGNWLYGVSATGDFYCDPNATIFSTDSASGIPANWNRRNINLLNALTLTATADNSSVKLTKNGTLSNTFEVNKGNGWEAYEFDTAIPLNAGQSCKWRCSAHPTTQSGSNYVQFVMAGTIEASGNCNSMLSSDFENLTSLTGYDYAFCRLFSSCTSLTKAPELPATELSNHCYHSTFFDCKSLVKSPELPATTLAEYCYYQMLIGCKSLVKSPELPATTLAEYCYYQMLFSCSNLKEVRIAATTTATYALDMWLNNVSATGDFYCDPNATIFPTDSVSGIPANWNRRALADYPITP